MSVEQQEAKRAVDELAREIHGIYGQHAANMGVKTPAWEELPEPAKAVSRDMAKLTLAKMQVAYSEGQKTAPPTQALNPNTATSLVASFTPERVAQLLAATVPHVNSILTHGNDLRPGPVNKGLEAALSKIVEATAINVIQTTPEMQSKIQEIVESQLHRFLTASKDDEKNDEEE